MNITKPKYNRITALKRLKELSEQRCVFSKKIKSDGPLYSFCYKNGGLASWCKKAKIQLLHQCKYPTLSAAMRALDLLKKKNRTLTLTKLSCIDATLYKFLKKKGIEAIKKHKPGKERKIHACFVKACKRHAYKVREAKGRYFCDLHRGWMKYGIIDQNGKQLREPTRGKGRRVKRICIVPGCGIVIFGQRFCPKHRSQYYSLKIIDRNGNKLRNLKIDNSRRNSKEKFKCLVKECTLIVGKGFKLCPKHRNQKHLGIIDGDGTLIREPYKPLLESTYLWNKIKHTCKDAMEDVNL